MSTHANDDASARAFLHSLGRELFQTESSASRHCRREAELVQRLEEELAWFAKHPAEALKLARPLVTALRSRPEATS